MKKPLIGVSLFILGAIASCKKDVSAPTAAATTPSALQQAIAATEAVSVEQDPLNSSDSVYVIKTDPANGTRDVIDFGTLPAGAGSFLNAGYNGFSPKTAFDVKDSTGAIIGYDAVIMYDSRPVGVRFDNNGNFTNVLEQSEGADLGGAFWHTGGLFDGRDGQGRDAVAPTALPSAVQTAFSNGYAQDSLLNAFQTKSGGYLLISQQNGGLAITNMNADGSLINRITPAEPSGAPAAVDLATLPASVASYLSTAYPGNFTEKAYAVNSNGMPQGYVLIVDDNNTKYSLQFDASGNYAGTQPFSSFIFPLPIYSPYQSQAPLF